jgi:hypothetical protein
MTPGSEHQPQAATSVKVFIISPSEKLQGKGESSPREFTGSSPTQFAKMSLPPRN